MAARGRRTIFRVAVGVLSLGLLTLTPLAPASAQGIFESIFGGLRRAIEAPASLPANIHAFADPSADMRNAPSQRAEAGPAMAYCVRSCDGHFFPVQAHAGLSAAQACHAFCPASKTRLYSGAAIDHAVAANGSRYADLDTAFLYRQQLVAGCTCNGRDPFGLAQVDVNTDPTLRPGDVVATKAGLVAFTGMKNKVADFTPVGSYRGLAKSTRDKLSELKIMPPNPGAPREITSSIRSAASAERTDDRHRAELAR